MDAFVVTAHIGSDYLSWKFLGIFALWYVAYGTFAYRLVFERTRPWTPVMPFLALCEDLELQLPGRKAAFIRKQVDASLALGDELGGYLNWKEKDWSHKNIRDQNLYAEVGAAMLPGPFYAFVVTAPLLYPVYSWVWKSLFPS